MEEQGRKRLRSQEELDAKKRLNTAQTPEKMSSKQESDSNMNNNEGTMADDTTLKEVLASINKLHDKFDAQASDLKSLQSMTLALNEKVVSLEAITDAQNTDMSGMRDELAYLKSVVSKQNDSILDLKAQTLDLTSWSMRDNLLFHNIPESKAALGAENCEALVTSAATKVGIPEKLYFERIHRLGPLTPSAKFPRPIVGNLPYKQGEVILAKTNKLPRNKSGFFVTRQTPTELREKKKKMWDKAESIKTNDPKCRTRIAADGRLFANGDLVREPFQTPSVRQMLSMSESDRDDLLHSGPRLYQGKTTNERGSTFTASAAHVSSLSEARQAYQVLLTDPNKMVARHNIGVYRITNPLTAKTEEDFADDGEHGAGRTIRNHLLRKNATNVVVFITRGSDGTHLGSRRFRLMEEAVDSALSKLTLKCD